MLQSLIGGKVAAKVFDRFKNIKKLVFLRSHEMLTMIDHILSHSLKTFQMIKAL